MNGIMNPIMNRGGCFHNLHKPAKMAIFQKKPRSTKKNSPRGCWRSPRSFEQKLPMGTLARAKCVRIS